MGNYVRQMRAAIRRHFDEGRDDGYVLAIIPGLNVEAERQAWIVHNAAQPPHKRSPAAQAAIAALSDEEDPNMRTMIPYRAHQRDANRPVIFTVGMHEGWYAVFEEGRFPEGRTERVVVSGVMYATDAYDAAAALNAMRITANTPKQD